MFYIAWKEFDYNVEAKFENNQIDFKENMFPLNYISWVDGK